MREPKRSHCPISLSLETVGDRWSLLILRDLLLRGKRRYSELLESEEGIATNILADRLARLARAGLITKSADRSRQVSYAPTKKGSDLLPVLRALANWGAKHDAYARKPPSGYLRANARNGA